MVSPLLTTKIDRRLGAFLRDESAQDLVEYSLLLAAIALAGAAAFIGMSGSTKVLWSVANNNLAAGNAGS
jgi:Flp pilus assembly pilin Flp